MNEKLVAINGLFNNIAAGDASNNEIDLLIAWLQTMKSPHQSVQEDGAICDLCKIILDEEGTCRVCTLAYSPRH